MKYIVSFSGKCEIEAANREEAENKFWDLVGNGQPLPDNLYDLNNCISKEKQVEYDRRRKAYEAMWHSPDYNPRKEIWKNLLTNLWNYDIINPSKEREEKQNDY